ncbi:hypothetical protein MHN80_13245 [Gordonia McavH-238-E]|uniref:hypothetical protein n=1 Tax=Gordonia sp. McavH-238-E TaxID=2917736 RepID=UPI001EF56B33|nr:hypothetical protein [Gordonia sp. McavH-238-E]MCG7633276.1 hypothetical protein [Gordonia sp. McavH-238-E]
MRRPLIPGHVGSYVVGLVLPRRAPECRVAAAILDAPELRCDAALALRFTDSVTPGGHEHHPYFELRGVR